LRVHFISIGGSIMHQLALNMQAKGYTITGSDDEIFDPSFSLLKEADLLPKEFGWFPQNIHTELDAVILGMHAKIDNPELLKAQELGLEILSFPEFVYRESQEKNRVVIAGSHGKTTITSMIMHVLGSKEKSFDFLVGARIAGFDRSVQISEENDLIILEGDEYLSSALERKPKFLFYIGNICVITGIAWDHINVFPTFENYCEQFRLLLGSLDENAIVIYNEEDEILKTLCESFGHWDLQLIPYQTPAYQVGKKGEFSWLRNSGKSVKLRVFGAHNIANMNAARLVCEQLGINEDDFAKSIASFSGAARRLEDLYVGENQAVYNDFAHAPSKVMASVKAVAELHADRNLVAVMELHTYSSLNKDFVPQYKGSLDAAEQAVVYYDPHTLKIKKLPALDEDFISKSFAHDNLMVFTDAEKLRSFLKEENWLNKDLLLMSSGKLGGLDKTEIVTFVSAIKSV